MAGIGGGQKNGRMGGKASKVVHEKVRDGGWGLQGSGMVDVEVDSRRRELEGVPTLWVGATCVW